MGPRLDHVPEHEDGRSVGPPGEVEHGSESRSRLGRVALADTLGRGIDGVDDDEVVGIQREGLPRWRIGERRGLVATDHLERRRVGAAPVA